MMPLGSAIRTTREASWADSVESQWGIAICLREDTPSVFPGTIDELKRLMRMPLLPVQTAKQVLRRGSVEILSAAITDLFR
ncbi:MAG: hypothetical protein EBE86_033905 [Hormoscilla sp. GUM202]|nr:hypothetical protein [Hormoscilla sp. GUM202]